MLPSCADFIRGCTANLLDAFSLLTHSKEAVVEGETLCFCRRDSRVAALGILVAAALEARSEGRSSGRRYTTTIPGTSSFGEAALIPQLSSGPEFPFSLCLFGSAQQRCGYEGPADVEILGEKFVRSSYCLQINFTPAGTLQISELVDRQATERIINALLQREQVADLLIETMKTFTASTDTFSLVSWVAPHETED